MNFAKGVMRGPRGAQRDTYSTKGRAMYELTDLY
jgi:hypothetical protein